MGATIKPVLQDTALQGTTPSSTNEGKIKPFFNRAMLIRPSTTQSTTSAVPIDSANMQAYKQYASQQEFGEQLIRNAVQDQAGGISSVSFSTEGKKRPNMAQQLGIK